MIQFQHRRLVATTFIATAFVMLYANQLQADENANTKSYQKTVKPFLARYCVGCHGPKQQKGERRFDVLSGNITNTKLLVDYQDILDQLNLGEMPPKKSRQPSNVQRKRVIAWLTSRIKRFHAEHKTTGGQTVLRRLNSREYRNTVRDLLHLNVSMFDPAKAFPRDQTNDHLDNVGETLVTSGYLLQQYLAAAEKVIQKAMPPLKKPTVQTWKFQDGFRQQPEIDRVHRHTNGFTFITLFDVVNADKHEGAYGPIMPFKQGVPVDGYYEIRFKAEALNRLHTYGPTFFGTDRDEPLRLGIVAGNLRAGPLHKPQPIEPLLAEMNLADESKWYTVRVWLDAGFTPRFTFRNGMMDARNIWSQVFRKFPGKVIRPKIRGIVGNRFNVIKFGKVPQIRIHEVEIKGPFYKSWPTKSQQAVLGDNTDPSQNTGLLTEQQIRKHLTNFASRAYRRPATPDEIDRLIKLIAIRQKAGRSSMEAYGDALKAVLCSPSFLYLDEPQGKQLSPYALASRLSYFLWSSMPDEKLTELAAANKLQEPAVLRQQVSRMLNDPRSAAFIDGFLDSWLTLRDLGSMPPDRRQFRAYYHYDLKNAMRQETRLFTKHLIEKNLSINNFLDSKFTFVNKPLAKLYGLKPPTGYGFQKVALTDSRRGGLLGQASILTVTANGIDTSPVNRGVWLLTNIFGTPPSPPPPDVEPLDPDIRGAKTIRDKLRKHRTVASCNECHRKIDPMGFALENFDPIGRWRTTYGRRIKIDATGKLPNGQAFHNIQSFKNILVNRRGQFATALTAKLLSYATGRQLNPGDRPHIDRMTKEVARKENGFRDLIISVVMSEPFRSK